MSPRKGDTGFAPATAPVQLAFASHIGVFIAADRLDDGCLAICLAAGSRAEHRVVVVDPRRGFARVCSFAIPNRARSGITRVVACGALVISGDDHSLSAFHSATGELAWQRTFPAPARVALIDALNGRILVSIVEAAGSAPETCIVRGEDGSDEATLPGVSVAGSTAPCLGPNGEVAIPWLRVVQLARAGAEARSIDLVATRFGVVDAAAFDARGDRLALGTRAGDVIVVDLASGTSRRVLDFTTSVRVVGFVGDEVWAMDADGKLRAGPTRADLDVDLGLPTHGGILAPDATSIAMSDLDTRTFRVRTLPDNRELFATSAGFQCESVAVTKDGDLVVSGPDAIVQLAADGSPPREVLADWLTTLVDANDACELSGDTALVTNELVIEVWSLASGERTARFDLGETWVGETNEAINSVFFSLGGELLVHLTSGEVLRVAELRAEGSEDAFVASLPSEGSLTIHPDGQSLYRTCGRSLTRVALTDFVESAPLELAIDAEIGGIQFSSSGKKLGVFHRNGRVSTLDIASGKSVAIDTPETSAAERDSNEVYVIDLQTPQQCAFSRDERRIVWTSGGGLSFADVETGALVGTLFIEGGARAYAVTDRASLDWTGAHDATPATLSPEIVARSGGRDLGHDELIGRARRGLLGTLT